MRSRIVLVLIIISLWFSCLLVEAAIPGMSSDTGTATSQNMSNIATSQPTATVTTYSSSGSRFVVNTTSAPYTPVVKKRLIIKTCDGNPAIGAKFQIRTMKAEEFQPLALSYDQVFSAPLSYDDIFEYPIDEIITGIKIDYPGYPQMSISGPLLENETIIGLCRPVNGTITLYPETFVSIVNSADIGTYYVHTKEIKDLNQAILSGDYDKANQVATNLTASIRSSVGIMGTDHTSTYGEGDLKLQDCGGFQCYYCWKYGGYAFGALCVSPPSGGGGGLKCAISRESYGFCAMDITLPNGTMYKASASEIFKTGIPFPTSAENVTSQNPSGTVSTSMGGNITPSAGAATQEGPIVTSPSLTQISTSPTITVKPGETQALQTQTETGPKSTSTSIPIDLITIIGALSIVICYSIFKK